MRRILVDHARHRDAQKRQAQKHPVTLDEAVVMAEARGEDLVALDEALTQLSKMDERLGRVVECRFFGGLSVEETASNILVTEDGQVKLLDFGIAKVLDEAEAAFLTAPLTQSGQRLMTPEYASPEQIRGQAITTATDVYQLGVLLYELLTGRRPYRLAERLRHEIERVILEEEPTRPSTAVEQTEEIQQGDQTTKITPEGVSRARSTSVEALQRRLSGDLDNIVLKALKKEPGRRYASVEQLAEDLRRHLVGLPVGRRRRWRCCS